MAETAVEQDALVGAVMGVGGEIVAELQRRYPALMAQIVRCSGSDAAYSLTATNLLDMLWFTYQCHSAAQLPTSAYDVLCAFPNVGLFSDATHAKAQVHITALCRALIRCGFAQAYRGGFHMLAPDAIVAKPTYLRLLRSDLPHKLALVDRLVRRRSGAGWLAVRYALLDDAPDDRQ